MSLIDTVTFDVWNTLLVHEFYDDRIKNARIGLIARAFEREGFSFSKEDILKAYNYSETCLSMLWRQERDACLEEHLALFLEGLGLEATGRNMSVIRLPYANAILDFKPSVVEGAQSTLLSLKKKGYRIGLISNTGRTPGETIRLILEGHGIMKYFDYAVFSNEAGYVKPNRKIFEIALRGLGSKAESAVHVGDSVLLDVYGAASAGMKAVHFNKYTERFERYAAQYYKAGDRYAAPDVTVERLADVVPAIEALSKKGI
ncbi:HAD family hydrolase [Methanocella conradii]|uniref:HAD family hydrolase n=1 Tax=Methanocella conradii TaxID=1175444 RepID=UPI00157D0DE1|nr:HAD family hydrolase [Methanocella conradii]